MDNSASARHPLIAAVPPAAIDFTKSLLSIFAADKAPTSGWSRMPAPHTVKRGGRNEAVSRAATRGKCISNLPRKSMSKYPVKEVLDTFQSDPN